MYCIWSLTVIGHWLMLTNLSWCVGTITPAPAGSFLYGVSMASCQMPKRLNRQSDERRSFRDAGAPLRADIWTEFDRITIGFPPLQTAPDCASWTLRYRLWREIDRSVLLSQGGGKTNKQNKDDNQIKSNAVSHGWLEPFRTPCCLGSSWRTWIYTHAHTHTNWKQPSCLAQLCHYETLRHSGPFLWNPILHSVAQSEQATEILRALPSRDGMTSEWLKC